MPNLKISIKNIKKPPSPPEASIKMNIRKSVDGNFMIFDHIDFDVVVMSKENKILAFGKQDVQSDQVYDSQNRMMDHLQRRGIIDPSSIQGGNIYGSLEAQILAPDSENVDPVQIAIFNIGKFMDEEKKYFEKVGSLEREEWENILAPDDEETTELGEIPHAKRKGTIHPGMIPYAYSYQYYE